MNRLKCADRMQNVHSDIRGPLFVEAMEMQARGIEVLRLNTGNPATFGFGLPDSIAQALVGQEEKGVGYCDFKGMPQAREAICAYERKKGIQGITPEDVFIGNGVSEVVSFALMPLLNPGDEVLVPTPNYSLWSNSVYLAGGRPVFYVCDEKAHWCPDAGDIRAKITDRTKAIVLINPNNPTGVLYPAEILSQVAEIARENDLLVFSDEIYDRLVMDGLEHTSFASLAPDLPVVTMNGLSKSHCLCGYRCGWMVISGPEHLTALEYAGAPGTTAALALLNDQVKKGGIMASSYVGGLSGAFIPVSEDQGMIDAVEAGALTLEKLEAMTCVCSVGLDMIAIPGDISPATISGIIADEMAIGMINQKTTAVRLVPVIGKGVGETVEFGGLLGHAPIMPVNPYKCDRFINRGGRIPAPVHSFKN